MSSIGYGYSPAAQFGGPYGGYTGVTAPADPYATNPGFQSAGLQNPGDQVLGLLTTMLASALINILTQNGGGGANALFASGNTPSFGGGGGDLFSNPGLFASGSDSSFGGSIPFGSPSLFSSGLGGNSFSNPGLFSTGLSSDPFGGASGDPYGSVFGDPYSSGGDPLTSPVSNLNYGSDPFGLGSQDPYSVPSLLGGSAFGNFSSPFGSLSPLASGQGLAGNAFGSTFSPFSLNSAFGGSPFGANGSLSSPDPFNPYAGLGGGFSPFSTLNTDPTALSPFSTLNNSSSFGSLSPFGTYDPSGLGSGGYNPNDPYGVLGSVYNNNSSFGSSSSFNGSPAAAPVSDEGDGEF